jgi:hypothetical protein
MKTRWRAGLVAAAISAFNAVPAGAAVVTITQQKALDGTVTPEDNPGFPISITRPGSYRLDTNIQVPLNKNGIAINTSNVTVDLNGFTIDGGGIGLIGVSGTATAHNVAVANGAITGFKLDGINGVGDYWLIAATRILHNGRDGITCGFACHVERSIVAENGDRGIAFRVGTAHGNTIVRNGLVGISSFFGGSGAFSNTLTNNSLDTAPGPETDGIASTHPNSCDPSCD